MWWEMGREEETDKRTRGPRHECDTETLTAATSASSWEWWCKRKRRFQACVGILTDSLRLKCINNFSTFLNTSPGLFLTPPSLLLTPKLCPQLYFIGSVFIFLANLHPSSRLLPDSSTVLNRDRWNCTYCRTPTPLLSHFGKKFNFFCSFEICLGISFCLCLALWPSFSPNKIRKNGVLSSCGFY